MKHNDLYQEHFARMIRNQSFEPSAMRTKDLSGSGYQVPTGQAHYFRDALAKENLFRRYGTEILTESGEETIIALTSTARAEITPEGNLYPTGDDRFDRIPFRDYKLASLCKLNQSFVSDTAFDVERYLLNEFARRFGRAEEKVLLNGTGVNEPLGLLQTVESKVTTTASAIAFDDIVKLYFSLDKEYCRDAIWIMNDETGFALRTLKDKNGNYLWNESNRTLLGQPIVFSPYMPSMASGAKPVIIGDLSYFWLLERKPLTIKVLSERFAVEGQVGYAAWERVDGKLIRPEAVRALSIG